MELNIPGVGGVALGAQFGLLSIEDNDPESREMRLLKHITEVFQGVNDSEMGLHVWHFYKNKAFSMLERANNDFVR